VDDMPRIAVKETYKDAQVIIKEGGHGEGTYVILSGAVDVTRSFQDKKVLIARLEKGDIFGELSYIDREPRTATVTAVGDVQIGLLDKNVLDAEINKMSEEFRGVITTLVKKIKELNMRYVEMTIENMKLKSK
jgi:CRP/FNR family transcriptional regulator